MTREEAMEELKILKEDYWDDDGYGHETKQYDDTMLALDMAIKALEQEPCKDVISRKSIKQKLQEHHDFFVNAYGGFSNLPQNDKSRVDEITNCIAMVVNEPPVIPQEPFINKLCVSSGVCEHDKQKVLDKIREQIDTMIKDIDKIQVYLDCHEGFADEYISKTKLMRIVDKYCGREIKDG